jgi:hypothetical protein
VDDQLAALPHEGGVIAIFDAQTGAEVERTAVDGGNATVHLDRGTRTILAFSTYDFLLPGLARAVDTPFMPYFHNPGGWRPSRACPG